MADGLLVAAMDMQAAVARSLQVPQGLAAGGAVQGAELQAEWPILPAQIAGGPPGSMAAQAMAASFARQLPMRKAAYVASAWYSLVPEAELHFVALWQTWD